MRDTFLNSSVRILSVCLLLSGQSDDWMHVCIAVDDGVGVLGIPCRRQPIFVLLGDGQRIAWNWDLYMMATGALFVNQCTEEQL